MQISNLFHDHCRIIAVIPQLPEMGSRRLILDELIKAKQIRFERS